MVFFLLFIFIAIPALEITLIIKIGKYMGIVPTLLLIFGIGIWGTFLARMQGLAVLRKTQNNLAQGVMPSSELLDGVLILVGSVLLIAPGFITDIIGLFFLIPWTRSLLKLFLRKKLEAMLRNGQATSFTYINRNNSKFDDIDI